MSNFLIADAQRIQQFTDNLAIGKTVLEIGTGSGVIANFCHQSGAESVIAVDINPHAVNHVKRAYPHIIVLESDLFSKINQQFDDIIFAAPWSVGTIRTPLDYALYDNGVVERFFREANEYLKPEGRIWVQYCDAFEDNFRLFPHWVSSSGFKITDQWSYSTYGRLVKRDVNVILYRIER